MILKAQITITFESKGVDYIGVKAHDPDMDFKDPSVGEAWAYPNEEGKDELNIYNVFVLPAYSRRGLGTRIVKELIRVGQSYEYKSAFLKSTRQGLELYKRLGFTIECDNDELIMQLGKGKNINVSIPMRLKLDG